MAGMVRLRADTGRPVAEDYQMPLGFTGKLDKLTLKIDRPKLTPDDEKRLSTTTQQQDERVSVNRGCVAECRPHWCSRRVIFNPSLYCSHQTHDGYEG